jgi:hypothetical protein
MSVVCSRSHGDRAWYLNATATRGGIIWWCTQHDPRPDQSLYSVRRFDKRTGTVTKVAAGSESAQAPTEEGPRAEEG